MKKVKGLCCKSDRSGLLHVRFILLNLFSQIKIYADGSLLLDALWMWIGGAGQVGDFCL
jgi:hypothetical protein